MGRQTGESPSWTYGQSLQLVAAVVVWLIAAQLAGALAAASVVHGVSPAWAFAVVVAGSSLASLIGRRVGPPERGRWAWPGSGPRPAAVQRALEGLGVGAARASRLRWMPHFLAVIGPLVLALAIFASAS